LENVRTYRDHPEIRKDPQKIVIIGGGKIGIGKASMFAPFNIDVTVLEKDKVLANWDWEIRNWVRRDFARREIKEICGISSHWGRSKNRIPVSLIPSATGLDG